MNAPSLPRFSPPSFRPAIVGLIFSGSPYAISRFIVSVIIESFKSESVRSIAHICVKVFKRFPALCNTYASSAIICKTFNIRIFAAINHCSPSYIYKTFTHTVCSSSITGSGLQTSQKATAGSSLTAAQGTRNYECVFSTFADTFPFCWIRSATAYLFYSSQFAEFLANINRRFHSSNIAGITT